MKKQKNILAQITATWFFSGKSPVAPGTVGSFCTLPFVYILYPLGFWGILTGTLITFFIGIPAIETVLKKTTSKDPGFVVIDEVAGQTATFLLATLICPELKLWHLLLGFALFRLFDIIKIWPASYFDSKVHSPFGVMMDDIIAGLYASILLYLAIAFF